MQALCPRLDLACHDANWTGPEDVVDVDVGRHNRDRTGASWYWWWSGVSSVWHIACMGEKADPACDGGSGRMDKVDGVFSRQWPEGAGWLQGPVWCGGTAQSMR